MKSAFSSVPEGKITATAQPKLDEVYDLKGLNLVAPDQVMPPGETPYAINNRRFADNDDETSIAMRTREGSIRLSVPVGETLDTQNTDTITGDVSVTLGRQVAIPFVAGSDGALTRYDLTIKKATGTYGTLVLEIRSDRMDLPGELIGQTSISSALVTGSYTSVSAYLMDAPEIEDGEKYWVVVKMRDLGIGTYSLAQTAGSGIRVSTDDRQTWIALNAIVRFKTYLSTTGIIKGFTKRYPEDTVKTTLFGLGTKLYTIEDPSTTPTELGTNLIDADTEKIRFATIDERTFIVDASGTNKTLEWDGTGTPIDNPAILDDLGNPVNAIIFQNRLLTVPAQDQTRVEFSALYDFVTPFPEVNFFYVGRPKSPDWITAWHEFREGLTIFTKETKHTVIGSSIQTFQPTAHVGTKGAVSQEATACGKEAIYFLADDRHIYSWNGSTDKLISFKVGPELKKILDLNKVRLHLYNNQLRVYYNKNPDDTVNHMLLYDIEQEQWFMDTGRPVVGSMEWTFDDNQLVEFSSKVGALYFGEETYSDMGKAIDFKYWTAYKLYGSGIARKRVKKFRPIVRPADSAYYLSVGRDFDYRNRPNMRPWLVDAGGAKWGTFNWGDGTVYGGSSLVDNQAPMSGRGKHVQYRFEHSGIDQPVNILGYAALVKIGRPR